MGKKIIAIIGAGPAGLSALKCVLDTAQYKSGEWEIVVYEAREDLGGVWLPASPTSATEPPPTPLYDSLTTNLPHPLMSFSDFPFPPETPLFPKAAVVLEYLRLYSSYYDLRKHIQFKTRVTKIDWCNGHWIIESSKSTSLGSGSEDSEEGKYRIQADLVMISNGHYASPRFPSTPGVQEWIDRGIATHSMWYRHPPPPPSSSSSSLATSPNLHGHQPHDSRERKGREIRILIVGAGPSGQDLVADFLALSPASHSSNSPTTQEELVYTYTVIHSTTGSPSESIPQANGNVLLRKPRVAQYHPLSPFNGSASHSKLTVTFDDGEVVTDINHVYLATGYNYSFPFLPPHILKAGYPPPLSSPSIGSTEGGRRDEVAEQGQLWNTSYSVHHLARHVWPISLSPSTAEHGDHTLPYPSTSLAFLALPSRVSPLPLVEVQAQAALSAFIFRSLLNLQREKKLIQGRYEELKQEGVEKWRRWHRFEEGREQFDYRESLASDYQLVSDKPDGHRVPEWHREIYELKGPLRSTWRALEHDGSWKEYVKGVGRDGWDGARGGYKDEEAVRTAEGEWEAVCWKVLERAGKGSAQGGQGKENGVDLGQI